MARRARVVPLPERPTLAQLLAEQTICGALLCADQGEWYWYRHQPATERQNRQERLKAISTAVLREAILDEPQDSGWMPPGLARFGIRGTLSWFVRWLPPSRGELLLEGDAPATSQRVTVPLPGLVLCGSGQTYAVWAVMEREFSPQSRAYHAPLSNIGPDGRMCFGSVPVPAVAWDALDLAWQRFIASPFTTHHADGRSRAFPTDVRRQWVRLAERRAARYPLADLRPLGMSRHPMTIADVVSHIIPRL
jgi:hypothetical protein